MADLVLVRWIVQSSTEYGWFSLILGDKYNLTLVKRCHSYFLISFKFIIAKRK